MDLFKVCFCSVLVASLYSTCLCVYGCVLVVAVIEQSSELAPHSKPPSPPFI